MLLDILFLRDTPGQAGFQDFNTGDASSGEADTPFNLKEILLRIFTNRVLIIVGLIEFCTGVLRNGVMHWFPIFAKEQIAADPVTSDAWKFWLNNWGLMLMLAGAGGGMLAGWMSDHLFGSRRAPVAGILYSVLLLAVIGMTVSLYGNPLLLGLLVSHCLGHGDRHTRDAERHGNDGFRREESRSHGGRTDRRTGLSRHRCAVARRSATSPHGTGSYWPVFLIPFAIAGIAHDADDLECDPEGESSSSLMTLASLTKTRTPGSCNGPGVASPTFSFLSLLFLASLRLQALRRIAVTLSSSFPMSTGSCVFSGMFSNTAYGTLNPFTVMYFGSRASSLSQSFVL